MISVLSMNVVWAYVLEIFESKNRMIGSSLLNIVAFFSIPLIFYCK